MGLNLLRDQVPRKLVASVIVIVSSIILITNTASSFAADVTLSLSSTPGYPGATLTVTLSIAYAGAPQATGFNLDIQYDTAVIELASFTATKGSVLIAAGKDLNTSQPSNPYYGIFRIVVIGSNQNIIGPGEAATIQFDVRGNAPLGETQLVVTNVAATDANGQALNATGLGGTVSVGFAPCWADIAPIPNGNCKVDLSDLVLMKTEYNRTDCSPSKPCYADIAPAPNGNNKVDLSDLVLMKTEYNRTNCCL